MATAARIAAGPAAMHSAVVAGWVVAGQRLAGHRVAGAMVRHAGPVARLVWSYLACAPALP